MVLNPLYLDTETTADTLVYIDQKDPANLALVILFGVQPSGVEHLQCAERYDKSAGHDHCLFTEFTAVHHDFTSGFRCFGFALVGSWG